MPEHSVFWSPDELCWAHIILPRCTQTIHQILLSLTPLALFPSRHVYILVAVRIFFVHAASYFLFPGGLFSGLLTIPRRTFPRGSIPRCSVISTAPNVSAPPPPGHQPLHKQLDSRHMRCFMHNLPILLTLWLTDWLTGLFRCNKRTSTLVTNQNKTPQ